MVRMVKSRDCYKEMAFTMGRCFLWSLEAYAPSAGPLEPVETPS